MATESVKINLPVEENKANDANAYTGIHKISKNGWFGVAKLLIKWGFIVGLSPSVLEKSRGNEESESKGSEKEGKKTYTINSFELIKITKSLYADLRRKGLIDAEAKEVLNWFYKGIRHWCNEKGMRCEDAVDKNLERADTEKLKKQLTSVLSNAIGEIEKEGWINAKSLRETLYTQLLQSNEKSNNMDIDDHTRIRASVFTALIMDDIFRKTGVKLEPIIVVRNPEFMDGTKYTYFINDPYKGVYIAEVRYKGRKREATVRGKNVLSYYMDDIKVYRDKEEGKTYLRIVFKYPSEPRANNDNLTTKVFDEYHDNLRSFVEKEGLYVNVTVNKAMSVVNPLVEEYKNSYLKQGGVVEKYVGTGFYVEKVNNGWRIVWQGPDELNNIPGLPGKADVGKARIAVDVLRKYIEFYGYAPQILRVLYYMVSAPLSYMIRKKDPFHKEFRHLLNFGTPALGKTRTTMLFARIHGLSEDNDRITAGSDLNIARLSRLVDRSTYPLIVDEGRSTIDIFTRPSNKALIDFIKSSTSTAAKRYISDGYGTRSFTFRSPLIFTLNELTDSLKKDLARRFIFNEFTEDHRKDKEKAERIWSAVARYMDDYMPHLGALIRDWILDNSERVIKWIEMLGTTQSYNDCGERSLIQEKMTELELGRLILRCTLKESLGIEDIEWLKYVDVPDNSDMVMDPYAMFIEFIKDAILEAYQRNVGRPLELNEQAKDCVKRHGGPRAGNIDTQHYDISGAVTWCERICVLAAERLLPKYIQVTPKGSVYIDSSSEKLINDIKRKYRNWSFSGSKEQFFKKLAELVERNWGSSKYTSYKLPSGESARAWRTSMHYWCQMLEEESMDLEM